MSDVIYLYIKTHNKTGLKYLGKTKKDPFKYRGSGVYWKNHIKKYGNDVLTTILAKCKTEKEIKKLRLHYSKLYNIVESNAWANLIEENGIGGVTGTCFKKGNTPVNKGQKMLSVSHSKKKYWETWRNENPNYKEKWKINTYQKKGYALVSETSRKQALINNSKLLACPHCNKETNVGNANRWHFNNCRLKDHGYNQSS